MGEVLQFRSPAFCVCEQPEADSLGNCRRCGRPINPRYEIILPGHARAEALDLGGALLAAATLREDADPFNNFGSALRREIIITRDGLYDGLATTMAREGQRR